MKLFKLIQLQFDQFRDAIQQYLSKTLSNYGTSYGNNTIFGQLINVLVGTTQNILSYTEDALTEQNVYTAQRKRSVYNLARISGYNPSLGTASTCIIKMSFMPNNSHSLDIVLNNKTKMTCSQNGLIYNILLPQEAIMLSIQHDNSSKYLTLVEGMFEEQTFISFGGQLYTQNVVFNGDCDIDYLEVYVNGEKWERCEGLYDMMADGKQYIVRTSLKKGIDIVFGNDEYGRALKNNDIIKVSYLIHSGEMGNINPNEECGFLFESPLTDISGNSVDGNQVFYIELQNKDNISCGTNSEDTSVVRQMIGLNSRALVLADAKNYDLFLKRFSFVGYNRTWGEEGSLVVNSIIMKNYASQLESGNDYFNLAETDFYLTDNQKKSIAQCISNSGQQLAGTSLNIFDPELVKYAAYIYIKLKKDTAYDTEYITTQIRNIVGEFFTNINSDIFVPKSDIVHLIKSNIEEVDGVDIYFLSQLNEEAKINRKYLNKTYSYDPSTGLYHIEEEMVYLYGNEDPGVGLDSHGNIYLNNNDQFPVLMGGWRFISSAEGEAIQYTTITDPLMIIYQ